MDQPPLPPPKNHHRTTMIEHIPEDPLRHPSHHRRARSDTSFLFDDLLILDLLPSPTPPHPYVASSMSVDDPPAADAAAAAAGCQGHFRSFSVDSDFFDSLGLGPEGTVGDSGSHMKGHRHSASMDGSEFEGDGVKRAMGADRLAELALIDPKRAKRILANRQSAARSKERKIKYTSELERKVQTLQTEATTLSAQVTLLQEWRLNLIPKRFTLMQSDTTGLTAKNKELKLRLQAMEQQAQLRDALNEALREEVQHLKIAAEQIPAGNGNAFGQAIPQYTSRQPQPQFGYNSPNQLQMAQLHVFQHCVGNEWAASAKFPGF